jgi:hypothetical protein
MKTIKTTLPLFTGFYSNERYEPNFNLILDNLQENRDCQDLKKIEVTSDDLDFNYNEFREELSKLICKDVECLCKEFIDESISIQYISHHAPNGYIQKDCIECAIKINDEQKIVEKYNETLLIMSDKDRKFFEDDIKEIENSLTNISDMISLILKVNECSEPEMSELDIEESIYCKGFNYYENLDEPSLYHLKFNNQDDFNNCSFWLRNYSGVQFDRYFEHFDLLIIDFKESVWNKVMNQLEYSPLCKFEYRISSEIF